MVQQLPPARADEPFDVRRLPGALGCCPYFIDTRTLQERCDPVPVDPIVVAEEVFGLLSEWHGVPKLLDHPLHARVLCGSQMDDSPTTVLEDQERVDRGEVDRRDGEEVDCPVGIGGPALAV